jgi:hypothetical protein
MYSLGMEKGLKTLGMLGKKPAKKLVWKVSPFII